MRERSAQPQKHPEKGEDRPLFERIEALVGWCQRGNEQGNEQDNETARLEQPPSAWALSRSAWKDGGARLRGQSLRRSRAGCRA